MNDFYVYVHYRLDRDVPMYVGRGRGHRAWAKGKNDRNVRWHNTVRKVGYRVEIVSDGLQSWEASQIEIDTISLYTKMGYPLVNMSSGGEYGSTGIKQSLETRRKKSDALKGEKHPNWKRKRTAEECNAMSIGQKNRFSADLALKLKMADYARKSKGNTGKHHSEELKSKFAKPHPAFKNKFTGEIIPAGSNFRKMCDDHGLANGNMYKVVRGDIQHNKGWELMTETVK